MHLTTSLANALNGLRQPEYTGENRCIPCTLVNLAIAVGLAVALAVVTTYSVGAAAFLLASAAIYFRGYLVPGTPALTKRYLPDRVLRAFGKAPNTFDDDLDVLAALTDLGAVYDGPGDDVTLAPDFAREWYARMGERDASTPRTDDLAALLDVDADDIDVQYHGDGACSAYLDADLVGTWPSPPAFNADVTADAVLSERRADWRRLPLAHRSELLAALRACLDTCPACRGTVSLGTETVESCCRTVDVVAADCAQCDARLFEVEVDPAWFDAATDPQ